MRPIWWFLIGAGGMFVILNVISSKSSVISNTNKRLQELAVTAQARNLIMTNEFRELVKTKEFKNFIASAGTDYLKTISKAIG
jgi:hypothetical protein